jgi:hypothetical protein
VKRWFLAAAYRRQVTDELVFYATVYQGVHPIEWVREYNHQHPDAVMAPLWWREVGEEVPLIEVEV